MAPGASPSAPTTRVRRLATDSVEATRGRTPPTARTARSIVDQYSGAPLLCAPCSSSPGRSEFVATLATVGKHLSTTKVPFFPPEVLPVVPAVPVVRAWTARTRAPGRGSRRSRSESRARVRERLVRERLVRERLVRDLFSPGGRNRRRRRTAGEGRRRSRSSRLRTIISWTRRGG